jgi:hypothetical protein
MVTFDEKAWRQRIAWLEANQGVALVSDDRTLWAVSMNGTLPDPGGEHWPPADWAGTSKVCSDEWKESIAEAVDYAISKQLTATEQLSCEREARDRYLANMSRYASSEEFYYEAAREIALERDAHRQSEAVAASSGELENQLAIDGLGYRSLEEVLAEIDTGRKDWPELFFSAEISDAFRDMWEEINRDVAGMSRDTAEQVRSWRVGGRKDWRSIANEYAALIGKPILGGNLLVGMAICNQAARILDEDSQ